MTPATSKPPRKRLPKQLAVIDADNCTGCEACIEVCPVDCIELLQFDLGVKGSQAWCEVDLERCIGCELCIRLPKKDKTDAYVQLVCPWEAIEMVPTEHAVELVAQVGGPPEYLRQHQERLLSVAQRQAELKRRGRRDSS
jgi:electron transport complex protein RnfB